MLLGTKQVISEAGIIACYRRAPKLVLAAAMSEQTRQQFAGELNHLRAN